METLLKTTTTNKHKPQNPKEEPIDLTGSQLQKSQWVFFIRTQPTISTFNFATMLHKSFIHYFETEGLTCYRQPSEVSEHILK